MPTPEKLFERAIAAYREGKHITAKKLITKIGRGLGSHPQILHLKAFIEVELGTAQNALNALNQAAIHFPDDGNIQNALGISLRKLSRYVESEKAHRRAIDLNPSDAAYHQNFGNLLSESGNLEGAVTAYSHALQLAPTFSDIAISLATDLNRLSRKNEAVIILESQIDRDPENIDLRIQLANIEHQSANLPAALSWYTSIAEIEPKNAAAAGGLMSIGVLQGSVEKSIASFECWQSTYGSNHELDGIYVHALNYLPTAKPVDIRTAAESARSKLRVSGPPPSIYRSRQSIKIGIISKKFGVHPVNFFSAPLMSAIDQDAIEFELFGSHVPENQASQSIKAMATHWHDITHMPPEERVAFIRSRNLDVAISPTGHEETEILELFRPRIAPVQIAAFAIFCTTGVKQMDGLLTDYYQTPNGYEDGYTEDLIRMPNGYVCFQPYDFLPPIDSINSQSKSITTYGSFNNLAKVCDSTLSLWSSILNVVPNSEILIKTQALGDEQTRQTFSNRAQSAGIDVNRLILEGPSSHLDLLKSYLRVDVALDPLAYSGGLTTLEALWMGTPVVTLPGNTFARRHSFSHLSVAGLNDWVAHSPEHYVEIAVQLAEETSSHNDFRKWLRGQIAASPTNDALAYARDFTKCLRNFIK